MTTRFTGRVAEVRAEHLLTELLTAQGWDPRRPPNGELLRQHEYKDHPHLSGIFKAKSGKIGAGDGLPEAVLIDRETLQPIAVIEAKAIVTDLPKAVHEATELYGSACIAAGFTPLAIALAGTSEDEFAVRVFKWNGEKWRPVTYDDNPIGWIPNRADAIRLIVPTAPAELRPSVPPPEVLAERANEINRLLRESKVLDALRPGIVAATMLALWQSKGNIRKEPGCILADINAACSQAFWGSGKADLAKSLVVDVANAELAVKMRRIVVILERLNVTVLTAEHDYLGQLYETFFRYTGGNTIGQFFTPRHVAAFMADLCQVGPDDVVLDPACGTGGFLISAMNRMQRIGKLSRTQVVDRVQKQLIGFDSEPQTAALCVANMILRGDGTTGVHRGNSFTVVDYPIGSAHVVLMNPPFPHKKTDVPPEKFINRALDGLQRRGMLATIVPQSILVKRDKNKWRESLLIKNTLEAVIVLPDELFQPYASVNTAVLILRKGIAHPSNHEVFFARVENDGFRMKKGVRVEQEGNLLPVIEAAFLNHHNIPGICSWAQYNINAGFAPGAYIQARILDEIQVDDGVLALIRSRTAFVAHHAHQLVTLNEERGEPYWKKRQKPPPTFITGQTIGGYFEIFYGQKALHNKEELLTGTSLIISSSGIDNGCYGFFDFDALIQPPFVTVPSTGSIAEAHVQEWPCGVTDDCLILVPKKDTPHEMLYIAAAVVRSEGWRFSYGRKATPSRIAGFPLPTDASLIARVRRYLDQAAQVELTILANAEDVIDARIAKQALAEIDKSELVRGDILNKKLALWES